MKLKEVEKYIKKIEEVNQNLLSQEWDVNKLGMRKESQRGNRKRISEL